MNLNELEIFLEKGNKVRGYLDVKIPQGVSNVENYLKGFKNGIEERYKINFLFNDVQDKKDENIYYLCFEKRVEEELQNA